MRVVLPLPLGPSSPVTPPVGTAALIPCRTSLRPRTTTRSRTSIAFSMRVSRSHQVVNSTLDEIWRLGKLLRVGGWVSWTLAWWDSRWGRRRRRSVSRCTPCGGTSWRGCRRPRSRWGTVRWTVRRGGPRRRALPAPDLLHREYPVQELPVPAQRHPERLGVRIVAVLMRIDRAELLGK